MEMARLEILKDGRAGVLGARTADYDSWLYEKYNVFNHHSGSLSELDVPDVVGFCVILPLSLFYPKRSPRTPSFERGFISIRSTD